MCAFSLFQTFYFWKGQTYKLELLSFNPWVSSTPQPQFYGLNICVSLPIHMLKSYPKGGSMGRWGLWEMPQACHVGRTLMSGIGALLSKRLQRDVQPFFAM